MKTLYIEANMGAAGDMLTAALVELFDDRNAVVAELNALGIPGVVYTLEESVKCGIKGSHMTVKIHGEEEEALEEAQECHHHHEHEHEHECCHHHEHEHEHECCHHHEHEHEHECCHHHEHEHEHECCHHHEHEHHHEHHHEHAHHHNSLGDIRAIIEGTKASSGVKKNAMEVYAIIAAAESHVHGRPVEEVHFHEVGAMDAVADVLAVCYLMEKLGAESVVASPINTGNGFCKTMHGILPVPAPATAKILEGMPSYDGGVRGELCTPTGAALIKKFASSYGQRPVMAVSKTGYGMGKKDFERANCVRVMLGESFSGKTDSVIELAVNIDDMTSEDIAYASGKILASGAVDVWTSPIYMKKGRPAVMLSALVLEDKESAVVSAIFRHTTTIGIRRSEKSRYVLSREIYEKETAYGPVTVKKSTGYGTVREKVEFEDLKRIAEATGEPIPVIRKKI